MSSVDHKNFTTLKQWLDWQETLHPVSMELKLQRIQEVYQRLKAPRPAPYVITVTGTNGKGSCVAMLDSIFRTARYRVGCYTSPHLVYYNERIKLNGVAISDANLIEQFERINAARGDITLTYFEFGTLAAFLAFAEQDLDVAVLEVGLGGRLDATNIIDADLAIISSIGLDHQQWLGNTRADIAREKAGILRPGKPAVCGDPDPPQNLLDLAAVQQTPLYCINQHFTYQIHADHWLWHSGEQSLRLPAPALTGAVQYQNAATVCMALELCHAQVPVKTGAIEVGLLSVNLPGRWQQLANEPTIYVDVAHNPDAFQRIAERLKSLPDSGSTHILLGVLADKAVDAMLAPLLPFIDFWHLVTPHSPRALPAEQLQQRLPESAQSRVYPDIATAWQQSRAQLQKNDRLLVTGSFFTVGVILAIESGHGVSGM